MQLHIYARYRSGRPWQPEIVLVGSTQKGTFIWQHGGTEFEMSWACDRGFLWARLFRANGTGTLLVLAYPCMRMLFFK